MMSGAVGSPFAWIWLLGAGALVVLVAGLVLAIVGRSGGRGPGTVRLGLGLAIISLFTIGALVGMAVFGAYPHSGQASAGPGSAGFSAGTVEAPRVVRVVAGPGLRFQPDAISVVAGETVRFEVTTMGMDVHEFMVGPAVDVAADKEGTPEVADLGMMQSASVTYTFDGPGPFAFACHAPGHYEAGMRGTISIQP